MTLSRKMFIGRVTLPGLAATSLYQLMRDSSLHWGFETTALTEPSLDSITGSEAQVTPDAPVYVGSDANTSQLTGILRTAAVPLDLKDFGDAFGIIDPNQIYFWNQSGTGMAVVFTAR